MMIVRSFPRLRFGLVSRFGLLLSAVIATSATTAFAEEKLVRYDFQRRLMGVDFKLKLYARDKSSANAAAKAAFGRIERLNAIFSDYDENSELRKLCRDARPGKPIRASRELFNILQKSGALSKQTNGAFDVTVGHLTRMWRRVRRRKKFPKAADLKFARSKTGYRFIKLDAKARTVELLKPEMRLDLGGIAKGYAGDEALAVLKKHGITRAMVDASGDIVVGDPPPGKSGWVIAVALLSRKRATKDARLLTLKNCAVATSGDAYQYVRIDGKRYSHIVDPKTGLGLTQRSSVTVIAKTGTAADSLASAVSVLGPNAGLKFATRLKAVEASVTTLRNEKPRTVSTCGFARYVK